VVVARTDLSVRRDHRAVDGRQNASGREHVGLSKQVFFNTTMHHLSLPGFSFFFLSSSPRPYLDTSATNLAAKAQARGGPASPRARLLCICVVMVVD
jgi:hypothetical protein